MKQIIFILMMFILPSGIMAQVDDLYYVPTKKKAKKELKITTNSDPIKVAPAIVGTPSSGTNVVRIGKKSNIVNDIDEDAYNRRSTTSAYSTEQEYTDEEVYDYEEEYVEEPASDADYTYSSRIVRFHSPRRAVILSSPLYWDVVYNCGLDNWTIYDDGIYWDVYPDYSYTTIYSPSWSWYTGCGWGFSFGWGHSSWYWNLGYHHSHWHYPYYPFGGIHHHHYGHYIAGGGWHHSFNGGYRNAAYSNRNGGGREGYVPRATGPARAATGVRSGTVARNDRNASAQSDRTVRRTSSTQRVYNRPSSTRNNVTRSNVTNERPRNNNVGQPSGSTRVNNAVREEINSNVNRDIRNTSQRKETTVNGSKNNSRNNRSLYNRSSSENRSSVSRSNNDRSNNSRSTVGSQSRSSNSRGSSFSSGSSRSGGSSFSGGGSRGGGGGRSGGGRR